MSRHRHQPFILKFRQRLYGGFCYWSFPSAGPIKNSSEILISDPFTGLYSESGDEIYEYDILARGDNYNSLIIWNQYGNYEEGTGFVLAELYSKGRYDRFHSTTAYTNGIVKVGNVYDNWNLLRGGKLKLSKYVDPLRMTLLSTGITYNQRSRV